ncbi:MAG: hypothetical protein EPO21_02850 [Chloroflexota bacterium]|nr:MAG: hypothetical protein EPO21_02850 [Chloroflexota bacterium]
MRPATHLLGLDTWETEDRVKAELGQPRASVACIGPAGEKLVRFAGIFNDKGHVAATNGPGAVMGSKKLKAIAVSSTTSKINLSDPERLRALARHDWADSASESLLGRSIKAGGTLGGMAALGMSGAFPIKNMTTCDISDYARYNLDDICSLVEMKPRPCWACPWAHCNDVTVKEGRYAGLKAELPEYEDMAAWGPLIGNADPAAAIMLSDLNDRLGMDVKEGGFTVSLAIECYEKGLIGPADTDGLELTWGNVEAIAELLQAIAHRRGFGEVLAEGVMRAAQRIGGEAEHFGVYHKNGIAPHTHDVRPKWATVLRQAVSDMGSGMSLDPQTSLYADIGHDKFSPAYSVEELAAGVAKIGPRHQFGDSLITCFFLLPKELSIMTEAVSLATGWDFTPEEALTVGRRILALQRAFNLRHGLTPDKDDILSSRIAEPPEMGPAQGRTVAPVFAEMKRVYYRHMGWDEETSKPLPETLRALGLEAVARDLWE